MVIINFKPDNCLINNEFIPFFAIDNFVVKVTILMDLKAFSKERY